MRRRWWLKLAALACGGVFAGDVIRRTFILPTKSQSKTPDDNKLIDKPYGYDMLYKDVKKFKHFDRRKIKCLFKTREEHLRLLQDPNKHFDVLVIGGGYHGAGVLFEAVTRGLCCALVDKHDFGAACDPAFNEAYAGSEPGIMGMGLLSSHLQYVHETKALFNSAAYMKDMTSVVVLCSNWCSLLKNYARLELRRFLCLGSHEASQDSSPQYLPYAEVKRLYPALRKPFCAIVYPLPQLNKSRLLIQTLLTASLEDYIAEMKGAVLGNYVEFVDFLKDKNGNIKGAKLFDKLGHKEFTVRAKVVVNCAGRDSDRILLKDQVDAATQVEATHNLWLALPTRLSNTTTTLLLPQIKFSRDHKGATTIRSQQNVTIAHSQLLFAGSQEAIESEKRRLKDVLTQVFDIGESKPMFHVTQGFRIRPGPGARSTSENASGSTINQRKIPVPEILTNWLRYDIRISKSGLITPVSGNWTSYRRRGRATVHRALVQHKDIIPVYLRPISYTLRLIGAYTTKTFDGTEQCPGEFIVPYVDYLQKQYNLQKDSSEHLVRCYGAHAVQVAELGTLTHLNDKLIPQLPALKVQVVYAIRKEMATNICDVIHRRLGLLLLTCGSE